MEPDELEEHLQLIEAATDDDWDEFLQDLFEEPWPCLRAQNQ